MKTHRDSRSVRWLGLMLFVVVALALGVGFQSQMSEILKTPVDTWRSNQTADCAVVLTGGAGRVREGVDLLVRHSVRKLIVSGVNPQAEWREIFPLWPFYQDVHESDIVLERRSQTTFGNAQQSAVLAEALGCKDLLIITSVYHMFRALKVFRTELHDRIPVKGRAVPMGPGDWAPWEFSLEAAKSMFYSLWAY